MKIRTYSELIQIDDFYKRFDYLKLGGVVGSETFGFDRYLNQKFYASQEWKDVRNEVIVRDNGFDLGIEGFEIGGRIYIHHMNPIDKSHITNHDPSILNPEFLISVSFNTHEAIHYGDESLLPQLMVERRPNDTKLW